MSDKKLFVVTIECHHEVVVMAEDMGEATDVVEDLLDEPGSYLRDEAVEYLSACASRELTPGDHIPSGYEHAIPWGASNELCVEETLKAKEEG